MRKGLIIMLAVFLCASFAYAKDLEVVKDVDGITVKTTLDKNPPVVGKNGITVELTDAGGKAVTDAKMRIDYSMPAMPGMPPMNYKTRPKLDGHVYRATMDLTMAGPWNIAIKFKKPGGKLLKATLNIDAR